MSVETDTRKPTTATRSRTLATARRLLPFERFSSQHGLSQSIVQSIHQDRGGFLWLGTEDGLNRFDGYDFTVFRHVTDDPTTLSFSEIKCILEDRDGALWVGTFGGLNRFDPVTETSRRFVHRPDDPDSLANDIVRALLLDRSDTLWVATQGGGLDRLDQTTGCFHHYRHDPRDEDSLSHDDVRALLEDDEGRIWIGTAGGGLDCFEPGERRFRHYRHDSGDPNSLGHDAVSVLHQDRKKRLWIGTRGGLSRLDEPAGDFVRYSAGPGGLSHDDVTAICEDDEGHLWIGSDGGGLDALDPDLGVLWHHRHDPHEPTSLSTDRVFSCCRDDSGLIWVGTYGAGGLNKGDPRQLRFAHHMHNPDDPNSLGHDIVWSMLEDRDSMIWVGTDGGLDRIDRDRGEVLHFRANPDDPHSLGHPGVRVVYEGTSGTLWLGTNGGLHRLDRDSGRFERWCHDPNDPTALSHDEIRSLYEDAEGGLWIGTLGGGLNHFDPATGTFTVCRHDPDDPTSLANDFVRPIFEDREGRLWIGMQGGGLDRLDRKTGRFVHYRHDPDDPESLSSDHVFAIWQDEAGFLWLGTYAGGLDRFDPRTGRVQRYDEDDGLPANLVYGLLGDTRGNLWLSSNKGLTRFDPRTEVFRTYDWRDGLQCDEFNGGSYYRSPRGELFFGGINGFNAFFAEELSDSPFEPPVVLSDFHLAGNSVEPGEVRNGRMPLDCALSCAEAIRLSYRDRVFSFQFAALDFTNPQKTRYAYRMLGFDKTWHHTDASRRFATYTNLPPGTYRFEVRATNCDGVWSAKAASIRVEIAPPWWGTWWFRSLAVAAAVGVAVRSYHDRVRTIRLETELDAAREAQQSIWPKDDPELPGFEIAGTSVPASEVGGDFFDYVWLDRERNNLCITIGDVAGKGMSAAMTAVMSSGMVAAKIEERRSLEELLRSINRSVFRKPTAAKFTALCLVRLVSPTRELRYVNAGMTEPLLKSANGVRFLATTDPRYPLGVHEEQPYREQTAQLVDGDVLVLYTDGVPEARNARGDLYGFAALERSLKSMDTDGMSSREILRALLGDVMAFAAGVSQQDDMTVVVVKTESNRRASPGL